MLFSIVVYAAAEQSQGAWSAYRFTCSALEGGHQIHRIFFYHDGVYNAADSHLPPQDEQSLSVHWQALSQQHSLDLTVCISAAKRRGVFDDVEAKRHQLTGANLADGFTLGGLGQYTEAVLVSDRIVSFGS